MENKNKKVFIINGRSGVGKDTLIGGLVEAGQHVLNVSTVDKVKEVALFAGWDGVKDDRGRQFLIDIRIAMVNYDDLINKYTVSKYQEFLTSDDEFMFIHCRDIPVIEYLKSQIPCKTILVTRNMQSISEHACDQILHEYKYDIVFENDAPIEESKKSFIKHIY